HTAYLFFLSRGRALDPDILLIGIQCTDLFDAWDVPLYDLRDGRLVALDATSTWPYLQGQLVQRTPRFVARSYIFGLLLAAVRHGVLYGQRPRVTWSIDAWARAKILLEVADIFARGGADGCAAAVVLTPCRNRIDPDAADPYGSLATDLDAASVPTLDSLAAMRRLTPDLGRLFFVGDWHLP